MLDLLVNPYEGIINNVNRKINKIERCKKKKAGHNSQKRSKG